MITSAVNSDICDKVEKGKETDGIRCRQTHPSRSIYCANDPSTIDREKISKCLTYTFEPWIDIELAIDDGISSTRNLKGDAL